MNNHEERPPAALAGGKFLISDAYDDYLKLMKLDKRKMPEFQIRETKRAFYGAVGQLLIFFQHGLAKSTEDEAVEAMTDLTTQVKAFFYEQNRGKN